MLKSFCGWRTFEAMRGDIQFGSHNGGWGMHPSDSICRAAGWSHRECRGNVFFRNYKKYKKCSVLDYILNSLLARKKTPGE
jgi:hypothetical protein